MSSKGSLCGWRSFTSTCWLWLMVCLAVTSCCGVILTPWQAGKWEASVCLTTSVPWETAGCLSPYACPGFIAPQWPAVNSSSCRCVPESRGRWPSGRHLPLLTLPSHLMASCFMRDWWHNWFSNLWDVFGIFSHAGCVALGIPMSDCLLFHLFGPDWNFAWKDCY